MRKRKNGRAVASALLIAGTLLAGCSSSKPAGSEVKAEVLTCTVSQENPIVKVIIKAPFKDEMVNSMEYVVIYDLGSAGVEGQDLLDQYGESMKSDMAQAYGIPEDKIDLKTEGNLLQASIVFDDPKEHLTDILGKEKVSDEDLVFSRFKSQIANKLMCE